VLEEEGPPRFETSIDVVGRTPDEVLQEHLRRFDLECGPPSGVPTHAEMRELRRGLPPAAGIDLVALARAVRKSINSGKPDRYFLYRVHRADGPTYILREGALPAEALYAPGATFELLDAFPDKKTAVFVWKRYERNEKPRPPSDAPPPPLLPQTWMRANCPHDR
jgi:hypothetical protein